MKWNDNPDKLESMALCGRMKIDRVLTIHDWYDGPRLGIAELDGIPHIYEAEFDYSTGEYGDTYYLSPVEQGLLKLILEDWEIWSRWQAKYKNGEVALDTHPALPEDRPRHETLKRELEGRLVTDPACRIYLRGRFLHGKPADNRDGYSVEWLSVD